MKIYPTTLPDALDLFECLVGVCNFSFVHQVVGGRRETDRAHVVVNPEDASKAVLALQSCCSPKQYTIR